MSFYRIMIVDDEEEIRDGIKSKIDWSGIGFELIGCAENGQEALEIFEALHPDVVMTDIKMPFMDGLTLGRHLCRLMPNIKLVIFSGFDDFEYAQKAIQINVTEYILKPIDAAELTAVLQKLKAQLDAEYAQKRDMEILRQHYVSSLPLLREQFLARLLDGRISQQRISEQAAQYSLDLEGFGWMAVLAHFDTGSSTGALIEQSELIPLSVKQLIDEHLGRYCRFKSFLYNDCVAIIAILDDQAQGQNLIGALNQICKLARRFLELTLSFGVGSICTSLENLRFSTAGARNALEYRVLTGAGRAIFIDDMEPDPTARLQFDEQDEHELTTAIKLATPIHIRHAVERFIGRFKAARLPLGQYRLYLLELLAGLLKVIHTYQIEPDEVFGQDFDGNFYLSSFDSLDSFGVWFTEICLKISSLIRRERTNSSREIAQNAKQFIAEHYADFNISVEMLCDYLHVSPAYFSTLFKKETGMSFVTYLTQFRMEKAINLLNTTENKTYEIALKIGYCEPNYFSYVFKKQYGISPTKYRSKDEGNG